MGHHIRVYKVGVNTDFKLLSSRNVEHFVMEGALDDLVAIVIPSSLDEDLGALTSTRAALAIVAVR